MAIPLPDLAATEALATQLASVLRPGDVLALRGDLGAGKTTLVQAIARRWGVADGDVRSPTFSLVDVHTLPSGAELVHVDLYRIDGPDGLAGLGLDELLGADDCICVVEWPDVAQHLLPPGGLALTLSTNGDERRAEVGPTLAARLNRG